MGMDSNLYVTKLQAPAFTMRLPHAVTGNHIRLCGIASSRCYAVGAVVDDDHRAWYREMFAPGVAAGLLRPADLAGYRNGSVYIRCSMHVPPTCEMVREAMPTANLF